MAQIVGSGVKPTIYIKPTVAKPTGTVVNTQNTTSTINVGASGVAPSNTAVGTIVNTAAGQYKVVAPNTPGAVQNTQSGLWSVKVPGTGPATATPQKNLAPVYKPPTAPANPASTPSYYNPSNASPKPQVPGTPQPMNKGAAATGNPRQAPRQTNSQGITIGDPLGKGLGYLKNQFNKTGQGIAQQYVTPQRKVEAQQATANSQQALAKVMQMVLEAGGKAGGGIEKYLQAQDTQGRQQYAGNPQLQQLGKSMTASLAKSGAQYEQSPLAKTMASATGVTRNVMDLFSPVYSADAVARGTGGALEKMDVALSSLPVVGPAVAGSVKLASKVIKIGDKTLDMAKVAKLGGGKFAKAIDNMASVEKKGAETVKNVRAMTMKEFGEGVDKEAFEVFHEKRINQIIGIDDTGKTFVVKLTDAPMKNTPLDTATSAVEAVTGTGKVAAPPAPKGPPVPETSFVKSAGEGTTPLFTPESNFPNDYKGTLADLERDAKTLYKNKDGTYRLTLQDGTKHTVDNAQFPDLNKDVIDRIAARAKEQGFVKPKDYTKSKELPKSGSERSSALLNKWAGEGATERAVKGRLAKEVQAKNLTQTQSDIALESYKLRQAGIVPDDVLDGAVKAIEGKKAGMKEGIPALEAYIKGLRNGTLDRDGAEALFQIMAPQLKMETGHLRVTVPKILDDIYPSHVSPSEFSKAAGATENPIAQLEVAAKSKVSGVEKLEDGWKITMQDGKKFVKPAEDMAPEYAKMLDDMAAGKTAEEAAPPVSAAERYLSGEDISKAEEQALIDDQKARAKKAREERKAELGREMTREETKEFNKAWYAEDNKTSGLKDIGATNTPGTHVQRGKIPQDAFDEMVIKDAMAAKSVGNSKKGAQWRVIAADGTVAVYKRSEVSPDVANYLDNLKNGVVNPEVPAAKAADTTPGKEYLEGKSAEELAPAAKEAEAPAAKTDTATTAAKGVEEPVTGGQNGTQRPTIDDLYEQVQKAKDDYNAQKADTTLKSAAMDDGAQIQMDSVEPQMAGVEPQEDVFGGDIPGTSAAGGAPPAGGGGATIPGSGIDDLNPANNIGTQPPKAKLSTGAKAAIGLGLAGGALGVNAMLGSTSDQSGAGEPASDADTDYVSAIDEALGLGSTDVVPQPGGNGPVVGGGGQPGMPQMPLADPGMGMGAEQPGANDGFTEVVFYMPNENGELEGPYQAVVDKDGWAWMVMEDGSLERVPEGAVVDSMGNDVADEATGMTGSGMWQRTPAGSVPYDPENPYIPQLSEILDEELDQVIMDNGGYTFENIMETYAPYLESQYAMIDEATEQQITALREQLAARGMYNSDIALTLEQQIRDGAEQQKALLYQEVSINAYNQAMEYSKWASEMAMQQQQNQFNQYDANRNFELDKATADRNYQLDVSQLDWNKFRDSRDYNLEVAKLNRSIRDSAPAGMDPQLYHAIYSEFGQLMQSGASEAQVAAQAVMMVNAGYGNASTIRKIANDAQAAVRSGYQFTSAE